MIINLEARNKNYEQAKSAGPDADSERNFDIIIQERRYFRQRLFNYHSLKGDRK
jgi:hypothetical protein